MPPKPEKNKTIKEVGIGKIKSGEVEGYISKYYEGEYQKAVITPTKSKGSDIPAKEYVENREKERRKEIRLKKKEESLQQISQQPSTSSDIKDIRSRLENTKITVREATKVTTIEPTKETKKPNKKKN